MTVKVRETLAVGPDGRGERLDLFLARTLAGISRKAVKRALDGGRVFVDGRVERRAGMVLGGEEIISLTLDEERPPQRVPDLTVLFRDDDLLAVDKPPGLAAHPTVGGRANALDLVREIPGVTAPILLHRLDADTSGVLLFALTDRANRSLSRQFADREVEKVYLALVAGEPPDVFHVRDHLRAGVRGRTVAVASGGQPSETHFQTLGRGPGFALVEARPRTGRTHQIRTHLASEGYPLLGDRLYGGPQFLRVEDRTLSAPRHLLHARELAFRHPAGGAPTVIPAPVPGDFREFIDRLGRDAGRRAGSGEL